MVGSRDSISECNVVLNTIAAQAFKEACDRLEAAPDFDLAVHDLIKEYATEHQRIVFNGNGYAPEWEEEAKRGDFRFFRPWLMPFRLLPQRRQ